MATLERAAVVAVVYLVVARASIELQDLSGLGAVFWPAAGVTVTGLLVSPRRAWAAILGAVGLTEFLHDLTLGSGWVPSLWWAVANVVGGLIAAGMVTRWRADRLDEVRRVLVFIAAAFAGPTLGGVLGAIGTVADGSQHGYLLIVGQWLIGDGLGILTVTPLGLVLFGRIPRAPLATFEAATALTAVAVISLLVFVPGPRHIVAALEYLVLIPMLWAAVRLRVAGAAAALFVAAQISNVATTLGRGPFAGPELTPIQASALTHLFLATVGATVLLLAARSVESATFHELAETREHLVAAVSHELRTPLTPIVGFSELLLQHGDDLDARTRKSIEVIQRNGRHLTALIDDLLMLSRARRTDLSVEPQPIEVAGVLNSLLHDRQDISTEVTTPDDVHLWADPMHVTQILTNLLDNAVRHGRPPVRIEVTDAGTEVEIAVIDRGPGVPAWFEPQLFEEFSQATTGDLRPTLGLGLGLPLARALALANDGELAYRRYRGSSRFAVTLPADRQ